MSAMAPELASNAVISACGRYRYVLARQVGPGTRSAAFILLNPSTADATRDDPTIRRCLGFARRWGCARLIVLNLFAFRATDLARLRRATDPVGPENRAWLERSLAGCGGGLVVCGWGVQGGYRDQDREVLGWLARLGMRLRALGLTRDGYPRHPLYVPYSAKLIPFARRNASRPLKQPHHGSLPTGLSRTGCARIAASCGS